ncbi:MAG: isoprenylcysteine carboxylmethyltransferase family protein, partial [Ignavibacteriae bacterium]|nr:isoprenylcysteine carboxylmethyltransferase family protein [Ignavibacteriota bacterium]
TVKPGEESEALITDGVFSISRNPMYVGMAFILLGIAILLGSVSTFFIIPIFVYIINKKFVIIEEKMLAEKFGRKWISYKEKTRSWI